MWSSNPCYLRVNCIYECLTHTKHYIKAQSSPYYRPVLVPQVGLCGADLLSIKERIKYVKGQKHYVRHNHNKLLQQS